jgi:glycosyltransferase involved in cell wall biosynthesis
MNFYRLRRQLHFATGFVIRNAGEIGLLLFIILIGLLVSMGLMHQIRFEILATTVAAFGIYAAFLTQQRAKMHDIIRSVDADFQALSPERERFSREVKKRKLDRWPKDDEDVDGILDFFDTLGSLVRAGAMSFVLADEQFAYWAVRYFVICLDRIKYRQSIHRYSYESFQWFVERIPEKDRGRTDRDALKLFVDEEAEP